MCLPPFDFRDRETPDLQGKSYSRTLHVPTSCGTPVIRWSKKDNNHLALLQLASGLIAFKKAHAATLTAALA